MYYGQITSVDPRAHKIARAMAKAGYSTAAATVTARWDDHSPLAQRYLEQYWEKRS